MNTASPMDRPLPYNVDFERGVIASALIHPPYLDHIEFLKPAHFYREDYAVVYETMLELRHDHMEIDPTTLMDALEHKGKLQMVGGFAAVTRFIEGFPTASHILSYAKGVYRDGIKRKGIGNAEKAVRTAYDSNNIIEFQQALKTAAESVTPLTDGDALNNYELGRRVLQQLQRTHDTGEAPLLPMGLAALTEHLPGWERTKVSVIGSLSSVGKTSTFVIDEGVNLAEQGYHVAIVELEIDATALVSRFLARIGAIDEWQLVSGFKPHDVPPPGKGNKYPHRRWNRESLEADTLTAADIFAELPISIIARDYEGDQQTEPDFTLEGIVTALKKLHAVKPIDYIVIDHLYILELLSGGDSYKASHEYGAMVMAFKRLAEFTRAHVVLLHQLDQKLALGMAVPNAMCFPGSQRIYHNTDNLIAYYQQSSHDKSVTDKNRRAFNFIKARRGIQGIVDNAYFDGAISRLISMPDTHQNGTSRLAERLTPTPADSDIIF